MCKDTPPGQKKGVDMDCDGCNAGPNQFVLKRSNDVSSDMYVMKRDAIEAICDARRK